MAVLLQFDRKMFQTLFLYTLCFLWCYNSLLSTDKLCKLWPIQTLQALHQLSTQYQQPHILDERIHCGYNDATLTIHIYLNQSTIMVLSQFETKPLYLSMVLELAAGIHWSIHNRVICEDKPQCYHVLIFNFTDITSQYICVTCAVKLFKWCTFHEPFEA